MLFTRVRERPHMARARVLSSRGVKVSSPFSCLTTISSVTVQASSPLGPVTETVWPSRPTVTPAGMEIACLPIRDISIHPAENFAADIGVSGGGVAHHAFGRGEDRDAQAVLDRLQIADPRIDPPAGLGDSADLGDHRLAVEILQFDLEFGEGARLLDEGEGANIALRLEDAEHPLAHLGSRSDDLRALARGGVLDPGDHVTDGVIDHF